MFKCFCPVGVYCIQIPYNVVISILCYIAYYSAIILHIKFVAIHCLLAPWASVKLAARCEHNLRHNFSVNSISIMVKLVLWNSLVWGFLLF